MRIDPQISAAQNAETNRVNEPRPGTAKNSSAPAAGGPSDTVQLSSDQATVRQLVGQLNQVPDVRQQQVSALRSEIKSGQFKRSNDQVAGAVVAQLFGINSNG